MSRTGTWPLPPGCCAAISASGATQESNLTSLGAARLTGFEDRLGHGGPCRSGSHALCERGPVGDSGDKVRLLARSAKGKLASRG